MTFKFIPTQSGYMRVEDSQKLLRAIFPNYPSLEPCHSAPRLEPIPQGSKEYLNEERMSLC
jgi:hypothetical protein